MRFRFTPLLWYGLLASSSALGQIVTDYGYPLTDPLAATVIGTPAEYQADLPETIPLRTRELLVFRGREVPDLFWFTANLRYSVSAQPGPAPLVFVLPGTGANFDAGKSLILQRALYQAGLHVVSLPSPLHPNFLVSASTSGRPGLLTADAEDIYRVMQLIRRHLEAELTITDFGLVGYSLGATNAAFVARLDHERQAFDFTRVLLINPPVNLYRSARILDRMFEEHVPTVAAFNALFERVMRVFSEFYSPAEPMVFSSELLYEIYQRRPIADSSLEALIGAVFRLTSMNLLFASDVMADVGVLAAPGRTPGITTSLTPYFKAAMVLSFQDYARRVLYPHYVQTSPDVTFDELVERESLRAIEDYLRTTPEIGLMHNVDDFTLSPDELEYLKIVFGDRARIYPTGGHNGNLAYRDNIADLIDFFTDRIRR
ncbi:MAG TPA: alpha/beta hydrolase [Geminicoccaceae bacterium]|jgi:acetyl esterase/lipase|nr:alpha/beta hydrolase [Geminicoccaceae bacterium]